MRTRELRIALLASVCCATAIGQTTVRVSLSTAGAQGNESSHRPCISGDGNYVAFTSGATNWEPGSTPFVSRVFLRDVANGITTCVSLDSAGHPEHGDGPDVSYDGRYVAFASMSALVSSDTNGAKDVYLRDRVTGALQLVSVASSGQLANDWSCMNDPPAVSDDARWVAFDSWASNLVPGDTNLQADVFVRDRQSGITRIVSVDSAGVLSDGRSEGAAISADGHIVVFSSSATNLVSGDTNGLIDVFAHDLQTGVTERVNVSSSGQQSSFSGGWPAVSADGRFVAYGSGSFNGPEVYVRDRVASSTELVVQGFAPSISADGNLVTFLTMAELMYVRDRQAGTTLLVSVNSAGAPANDSVWAHPGAISADGARYVFASEATNLVAGDTNNAPDVFLHDRSGLVPPTAYCSAKTNSAGCLPQIVSTGAPSASAGGGFSIGAKQVLEQRSGLLAYSLLGAESYPFYGGIRCIGAAARRTPMQTSASTGTPPCAGSYTFEFNQWVASGVDPALVAGQQVWAQYWMRDGAASFGVGLTGGLTFVIAP